MKKELRSEVAANQRTLQQYGMESGDSVVFFNGIVLQTDSADAFRCRLSVMSFAPQSSPLSLPSVLEVLLSESRLLAGLTSLGLSVSDAHTVVQTPVHSQAQSFAVDLRSESVVVSHMNVMW